MKSGPTKFSRSFVKTCIEYKINRVNTMRDYDVVVDHERGLSNEQIAIKYSISKTMVFKIIHKLK